MDILACLKIDNEDFVCSNSLREKYLKNEASFQNLMLQTINYYNTYGLSKFSDVPYKAFKDKSFGICLSNEVKQHHAINNDLNILNENDNIKEIKRYLYEKGPIIGYFKSNQQ